MILKGKVALVTGSGSGIGKAMVTAFAKEQAAVVIADINESNANEVAQSLSRQYGVRAIAVKVDVTDATDVENMINKTIKELGALDILINNAGIGQEFVPTIDQSIEKWDKIISTHLRGTYLCSRQAGRWMISQKSGTILNIASIVGCGGFPMRTAYGPAKAAIINMTEVLAVEWAPYNIRVNCIAPGYILTPLIENKMKNGILNTEGIIKRTPLGRLGSPEEIAQAALFLVSENASYITGVTLPVDGGWLANRYI